MTFEEFYKKYTNTLYSLSKASLADVGIIRDELNELCNQYPDYEDQVMEKIWQEVNRAS